MRFLFPILEIIPALSGELALYIFFKPFRYPFKREELDYIDKAEIGSLIYQGKKVQTYTWGEGIPVILVHGWNGRAAQFYKFIDPLVQNNYKVVSFDGIGHGKSGGSRTSLFEFMDIVKELTRSSGAEFIIGHSMGGAVAVMSQKEIQRFKKVITIGSPTIGEGMLNGFLEWINATHRSEGPIIKHIEKISGKKINELEAVNYYEKSNSDKYVIIHDRYDAEVDIEQAYELKKAFPDITLKVTENLGHTRMLRNPELIQYVLGELNTAVDSKKVTFIEK